MKTANGIGVDYEQARFNTIVIQADDGHGGVSQPITLRVNTRNVLIENVTGTDAADRIWATPGTTSCPAGTGSGTTR